MVRAPYPARIAAGLIVTAIEETRKLPTLAVTLPMTAVSQTLQAGMRMQQNIAELAIKGDHALEQIFDRPDEQPEWARFDEDDDDQVPSAGTTTRDIADQIDSEPVDVGEITANPEVEPDLASAGAEIVAPQPLDTEDAEKTKATEKVKATPPKSAKRATGKTSPSAKADTASGRFALYSSTPDTLDTSEGPTPNGSSDGPVPEIVEYLEYDGLTLAQLRAKIRSISLGELEELALYERSTRGRAPFVTMLDNRITAQKNKRQSAT